MTSYESTQSFANHKLASMASLDDRLTALLSSVCTQTEWEYGEAWIFQAQDQLLELSSAWSLKPDLAFARSQAWMQFQICSRAFVLHPGEGLPGRVLRSRAPEWIVDVSCASESYFLRHQIAKALSAKAGLGIPLTLDTLQIVLVFFQSEAGFVDRDLLQQTQAAIESALLFLR